MPFAFVLSTINFFFFYVFLFLGILGKGCHLIGLLISGQRPVMVTFYVLFLCLFVGLSFFFFALPLQFLAFPHTDTHTHFSIN